MDTDSNTERQFAEISTVTMQGWAKVRFDPFDACLSIVPLFSNRLILAEHAIVSMACPEKLEKPFRASGFAIWPVSARGLGKITV
jgi:hypothetical protein